jgi:large subunit ribosomal protein L15
MDPMDLSNLAPSKGAVKNRKRVGRGPGSGLGKTSGRGHKGAGQRAGASIKPGFEGGQMPLQRRLPKHGFRNPFRTEYAVINLDELEQRFESGADVDPAALLERRMVRKGQPVKILARGELKKSLNVKAHAFSGKAKESIAAAGGSAEVIERA